jgi:DNA invertase Pin-like site-specific DNA recombinase
MRRSGLSHSIKWSHHGLEYGRLVKSISRFSRNTKDCLATLRELTSLGVSVYFEKENISQNLRLSRRLK